MGKERVMILTEPAANAHSFFHKQLILGLSNVISQWVEDETEGEMLPIEEAKKKHTFQGLFTGVNSGQNSAVVVTDGAIWPLQLGRCHEAVALSS